MVTFAIFDFTSKAAGVRMTDTFLHFCHKFQSGEGFKNVVRKMVKRCMQRYIFLYSTVTFTIFHFTSELWSCWRQDDGHISALYARLKCQKHPARRAIQRKDADAKIIIERFETKIKITLQCKWGELICPNLAKLVLMPEHKWNSAAGPYWVSLSIQSLYTDSHSAQRSYSHIHIHSKTHLHTCALLRHEKYLQTYTFKMQVFNNLRFRYLNITCVLVNLDHLYHCALWPKDQVLNHSAMSAMQCNILETKRDTVQCCASFKILLHRPVEQLAEI